MRIDLAKLLGVIAATLVVSAITGLAVWTFQMAERISVLERTDSALEQRLNGLETGRTTPMSADARIRFEEIEQRLNRQIGHLEADVAKLQMQHEDLLKLHLKAGNK